MKQIPHGPKELYCHHWHKSMDKVCHTCPLWTHIAGKDPNTGDRVDEWRCAESWEPVLLMEIAHKLNQLSAEVGEQRREQAVREVTALNLAVGAHRGLQQAEMLTHSTSAPAILLESKPTE